jgi:hypothetical protein
VYDPATNMLYLVDTGPGVSGVAGGLVALAVQSDCSLKVAWSQTVGTAISNSPNSTPTLANGVVYVGVNDGSVSAFNASTGANQTLTSQWVDTKSGDTFWVQDQNSPVAAAGSQVTINDTAPTNHRWNLAAVEILGSVVTAPAAPAAPSGVSAVPGDQSATVSWTAPASNGGPITSYTVTPYIGTTAQTATTVTGNPPATSVTIGGLTDGTAYTFTVVATNAIGSSQPSAPSPAVTPSKSASPKTDVDISVNGTGTTATTAAFSTAQASEVLVAFVAADGPSGNGQTSTVSGGGLTWKLSARANGQNGTAEIWTATATSVLTNVTVSSTEAKTGFHQSLTVLSFTGSGGIGATSTAGAASGAPTIGITTTKNSSVVYAVGEDWDQAIARTVGTGQTMVSQWVDSAAGETFWAQQITYPVASPALVTLNDSAPAADRWNLAAIEVTGS